MSWQVADAITALLPQSSQGDVDTILRSFGQPGVTAFGNRGSHTFAGLHARPLAPGRMGDATVQQQTGGGGERTWWDTGMDAGAAGLLVGAAAYGLGVHGDVARGAAHVAGAVYNNQMLGTMANTAFKAGVQTIASGAKATLPHVLSNEAHRRGLCDPCVPDLTPNQRLLPSLQSGNRGVSIAGPAPTISGAQRAKVRGKRDNKRIKPPPQVRRGRKRKKKPLPGRGGKKKKTKRNARGQFQKGSGVAKKKAAKKTAAASTPAAAGVKF